MTQRVATLAGVPGVKGANDGGFTPAQSTERSPAGDFHRVANSLGSYAGRGRLADLERRLARLEGRARA